MRPARVSPSSTLLFDGVRGEELLAAIIENSEDAIYSRKLNGVITSWNAGAERIFGYSRAETIGKSSEFLLPGDRRQETRRILDRIGRGIRVEALETVRLRKSGDAIHVSLTVSPVRNASGRIIGALTVARDITTERDLQARLLEVSERERRRIGRDLHDGLGQQLAGIELLCRTLARSLSKHGSPEARTAKLLVAQVRSATSQSRSLARGLTPVMEHPNGLMLALEELVRTSRTLFRIDCVFDCEEPVLVLNHRMATHLFRIAQEAVTNAVRHGKARRVFIRLRRRLRSLVLEIEDRGSGFSGPASQTGIGLALMRFRAGRIGGNLQVKSASPRGVIVTCVAPLLLANAKEGQS